MDAMTRRTIDLEHRLNTAARDLASTVAAMIEHGTLDADGLREKVDDYNAARAAYLGD